MTKSILITGATRGLGKNLAKQFARRGYNLALTGRDMGALQQLAHKIKIPTTRIAIRALDVSDFNSIAAVIGECATELGGLDIVIVNAGVGFATPTGSADFDLVRKTIDVNLIGAIATAEAAVALFREQGKGHIVGISSISRVRGQKNMGAYCASKAGFSRYLESLRCETLDEQIVVTELAPGFIDTDLNRDIPNRPFLVTAEKGTRIMADLIERQVKFRYVPPWPWTLVAQFLKAASDKTIARQG